MTKKGVTLSILIVVIIVLAILATTVVTSVSSSINDTKLSLWATEISLVQDVVKENRDNIDDILLNEISFSTKKIATEILDEQFKDEVITNNEIILYGINLSRIDIKNLMYGRNDRDNDVYAYSKTTGRVYYLEGIRVSKKQIYYTVTPDLANRYSEQIGISGEPSTIVFVPNTVNYTNEPVTVTVKVPKAYTDIQITISNNNNGIVVGAQQEEDTWYVYEVNSTRLAGNYVINVSYKDNGESKNAKFAVTIYDDTAPTIESALKVLGQGVVKVKDNLSGIKEIRYITGKNPTENVQQYFKEYGNKVSKTTFGLDNQELEVTVYIEDKAGNYVVQKAENGVPESWKTSVREVTTDNVPIPIGFVKSPYEGEGIKNGGLVIYALTEQEIKDGVTDITKKDANYQTSLESRNQFVWIPVNSDRFKTKFVRTNNGWKDDEGNDKYILSPTLGTNYWELVLTTASMPSQNTQLDNIASYVSSTTLAEATAMYASVKKYGGFYIARYEAGSNTIFNDSSKGYIATRATKDNMSHLSVSMGKYPYSKVAWGTSTSEDTSNSGAVSLARAFYPSNGTVYGVVSTLTYGVQWDRTLAWWEELDALDEEDNLDLTSISEYGSYWATIIASEDVNPNAKYSLYKSAVYQPWAAFTEKTIYENWLLTTGAYKKAKVYNIYDMASNLTEWTMEGSSDNCHVLRGTFFDYLGMNDPVLNRRAAIYNGADGVFGFRPSLYIK